MEDLKLHQKPVLGFKVGQASRSQRSQSAQLFLKNPSYRKPSNDILVTTRSLLKSDLATASQHAFLLSSIPQQQLPQARCLPRRRRPQWEFLSPVQICPGEEVVLRVVQLRALGLDL